MKDKKQVDDKTLKTLKESIVDFDEQKVPKIKKEKITTSKEKKFTCGIDRSKNDCGDASEY